MAVKKTEVVREFPAISKYRIRVLAKGEKRTLDLREYLSVDSYEGYTRRGITLSSRAHVEQLRDILNEVIESGSMIAE